MFTTKSLVMRGLICLFFLSFFVLESIAQDGISDSVFYRQEQLMRMKEMERVRQLRKRFKDDMKAFRDSLNAIRRVEAEREAQNRLKRYLNNDRIDTLKTIDLSYAKLEAFPDFVLEASDLEVLRIDGNEFHKIPRKTKKLKNLRKIYWSENFFKRNPRFSKNETVKELIFKGNEFQRIPNFRKMGSLNKLDLSDNDLKSIPLKQLRRNSHLKELILKDNPLVLGEDKYHLISFLKILKVNKCGIVDIHPSFYKIEGLQELQLQENFLKELPDGISALSKLSKLSLYKNKIENLPQDLFDLPNLIVIDLYYNELERIPTNIVKAKNLEVLFLAHNKIYDVPDEIGELVELRELYLHHNRISWIPTSFDNLVGLRVFRINHNYLSEFPDQILSMKKLRDLDLEENDIESIPPNIEELDELNLFTFDGNNINFDLAENQELARSIIRMTEKGVTCKPSISQEYIDENGNEIDINTGQQ